MNRFMVIQLLLVVSLLTSTVSCNKETDFITEVLQNNEEEMVIDLTNTIVLPKDFDWSNIPDTYADAVWLIAYDFDLSGKTINLPKNVTLYFSGGSLANGEIKGNLTTIASKVQQPAFKKLNLSGTYVKDQYLMPYWFGAAMDGVTDDRTAFVETLAQAHAITAKVFIEKDMFLDVEEIGTKSIFLEDNTWIEGKNDAKIIVNNQFSPVFWMALSENIRFQNLIVEWDQKYDAANMDPLGNSGINQQTIENYLIANRQAIYSSVNPLFEGGLSFRAIFLLDGAQNITFNNVGIKAVDGVTADRFIPMGIKFKSQFAGNQTISSESKTTSRVVTKNINFNNVTFDGTLMALQGTVQDFITNGMKSFRYSDAQTAQGDHVGANRGNNTYAFPPPHLMYINSNHLGDNPKNIQILNTYDYGEYVGSTKVRSTISGYCVSLTVTGTHDNLLVDNYKSFRRDGFLGVQDMSNSTFRDIYTEYDSSIFRSLGNNDFNNIRFVGTLDNVSFENITIKDIAEVSDFYPLDFTNGSNVIMENVNIILKSLNTTKPGCFGFNGSNNTIKNSSLIIEKQHLSKNEFLGVIFSNDDSRDNSKNNNYEITVEGWRNIDDNPINKSIRMLFASASNTNTNYAKVTDVSNNMVIEQTNATQRNYWTRTEEVVLGSGTSQQLKLSIPAGFMVKNVRAETLEALANGIQVSLGTHSGQRRNLIDNLSKTEGSVAKAINETRAENGNRNVFLYGSGDFNNLGKIKLTLELVRESQYE